MPTRRTILARSVSAGAGVLGVAFGSGAFTEVEADRDFAFEIAADDASQLSIELTELGEASDAIDLTQEGDVEVLEFDDDRLSPGARVSYGRFDDLAAPTDLEDALFTITNENETEAAIDLSLGLALQEADPDHDSVVELVAEGPDGEFESATTEGTMASVEAIDHGETVALGLIIDTDTPDELEATLSIEAERVDNDA